MHLVLRCRFHIPNSCVSLKMVLSQDYLHINSYIWQIFNKVVGIRCLACLFHQLLFLFIREISCGGTSKSIGNILKDCAAEEHWFLLHVSVNRRYHIQSGSVLSYLLDKSEASSQPLQIQRLNGVSIQYDGVIRAWIPPLEQSKKRTLSRPAGAD